MDKTATGTGLAGVGRIDGHQLKAELLLTLAQRLAKVALAKAELRMIERAIRFLRFVAQPFA